MHVQRGRDCAFEHRLRHGRVDEPRYHDVLRQ
jgi:hypothetical protein